MDEFDTRKSMNLRKRGIYLLPNLFTTGALFAGFYAIVQAMNAHFEHSAVAIFIAMVLDGLDGRVARLTHTQSEFGAEYDSLSDMVSFGVAPSLVVYEWALKGLGKLGWFAAFIYCASTALRLARFNTNIDVVDKRYFQGLPSPAAAALIAGFVWVMHDHEISGDSIHWYAAVLAVFAGLSMVSNLPLLQLQGFQHAQKRPVCCDLSGRAVLHLHFQLPAWCAVRVVPVLCPVRLRAVGLAQKTETQAYCMSR